MPREKKPEVPQQLTNPLFDPLTTTSSTPVAFTSQGNVLDWDMQDLVWSNLPWDWNVMDDSLMDGVGDAGFGWGNIVQEDGQGNGDQSQQQGETMGMPVL